MVIRGKILATDVRELRAVIPFIFSISDFTDTISVKVFAREESLEDLKTATKAGQFVRLKGVANIDRFDGELTIGSVVGVLKMRGFYDETRGQCSGQACGTAPPYQDERYGRRFRGKGPPLSGPNSGEWTRWR